MSTMSSTADADRDAEAEETNLYDHAPSFSGEISRDVFETVARWFAGVADEVEIAITEDEWSLQLRVPAFEKALAVSATLPTEDWDDYEVSQAGVLAIDPHAGLYKLCTQSSGDSLTVEVDSVSVSVNDEVRPTLTTAPAEPEFSVPRLDNYMKATVQDAEVLRNWFTGNAGSGKAVRLGMSRLPTMYRRRSHKFSLEQVGRETGEVADTALVLEELDTFEDGVGIEKMNLSRKIDRVYGALPDETDERHGEWAYYRSEPLASLFRHFKKSLTEGVAVEVEFSDHFPMTLSRSVGGADTSAEGTLYAMLAPIPNSEWEGTDVPIYGEKPSGQVRMS